MSRCILQVETLSETYFKIVHFRLILAQAGVDYEDERIERDSWMALKPSNIKSILPYIFQKNLYSYFSCTRYSMWSIACIRIQWGKNCPINDNREIFGQGIQFSWTKYTYLPSFDTFLCFQ